MTAYLIVTSILICLVGAGSVATYCFVKREKAALVRAAGEFAIAGWGLWLLLR